MPLAMNIANAPRIGGDIYLIIQGLLTGTYPGAAGETVDLTTVTNTLGKDIEGFFENPSIGGVFTCNLNGYTVTLEPGTTLSNWKLKIFASGNTGLGNVTYASVGITTPENVVNLVFLRRLM